MGKAWEKKQIERLVLKQDVKIAKLEKEIAQESQLKFESEQLSKELNEENPKNNSTEK
jgi:hypothetical protein